MTRSNLLMCLLCCMFMCASYTTSAQVFSSKINLDDPTQQHLLITKRGDRMLGRILKIEGTNVLFQMTIGSELSFAFQDIEWIGPEDEKRSVEKKQERRPRQGYGLQVDPSENGCENLLFSPTGFNFPKGGGEYRNIEIAVNTADVGITDHFSVGGGMVLPVVFILRFKGTIDYNDILHFGAGTNTFIPIVDDSRALTHLYGAVTLGTPKAYLNATAGYGFIWGNRSPIGIPDDRETVPLIATFGGAVTIAERFRFMIDIAYLGSDDVNNSLSPSLMVGWINTKSRFELGLISIISDGEVLPLPVLAYARRF